MEARDVQPSKAEDPISVTPFGIVMEARDVQPSKADAPICVILSGIMVFLHPTTSVLDFVSIIALQLFLLS